MKTYAEALETLCEIEGATEEELCEVAADEGVAAGICLNEGCNATGEVEPDCDDGYCEDCGTPSVVSVLVLAGFI